MRIDLPAEVTNDDDRFVQINVYGARLDQFNKVHFLTFLKGMGYSDCAVMEITLCGLSKKSNANHAEKQLEMEEPLSTGVLNNIKEESLDLELETVRVDATGQDLSARNSCSVQPISSACRDLFNADISMITPIGGRANATFDWELSTGLEQLICPETDIASSSQRHSVIPELRRTSTRNDEQSAVQVDHGVGFSSQESCIRTATIISSPATISSSQQDEHITTMLRESQERSNFIDGRAERSVGDQLDYSYAYKNPSYSAASDLREKLLCEEEIKQEFKTISHDANISTNGNVSLNPGCASSGKAGALLPSSANPNFGRDMTPENCYLNLPDHVLSDGDERFEDAPQFFEAPENPRISTSKADTDSPDFGKPPQHDTIRVLRQRKRPSAEEEYSCRYQGCNWRVKQRHHYCKKKIIAHCLSHSPSSTLPCPEKGCARIFRNIKKVIKHYENDHPSAPIPELSQIRSLKENSIPEDLEKELWINCFPEYVEDMAESGWSKFVEIRNVLRQRHSSSK